MPCLVPPSSLPPTTTTTLPTWVLTWTASHALATKFSYPSITAGKSTIVIQVKHWAEHPIHTSTYPLLWYHRESRVPVENGYGLDREKDMNNIYIYLLTRYIYVKPNSSLSKVILRAPHLSETDRSSIIFFFCSTFYLSLYLVYNISRLPLVLSIYSNNLVFVVSHNFYILSYKTQTLYSPSPLHWISTILVQPDIHPKAGLRNTFTPTTHA